MARDTGFELKIDQFNTFTRELSRLSRADLPKVIRSETAKILQVAAKETKRATAASIRKSQERRSPWRTYNHKKINTSWRFPDAKWAFISSNLEASLSKKIAKANLATSIWVDMAKNLNLAIKKPPRFKEPKKPLGWSGRVFTMENLDNDNFFIQIAGYADILKYANGRQALFKAIAGRIKFFEMNMNRGVFKRSEAIAKKYPGIKVTS